MRRNLILFLCIVVLADVVLAQVAKRFVPGLHVAGSEQTYRISLEPFHHGLAEMVEVTGTWGSLRYPMRTNSLGFKDSSARIVPLRSAAYRVLVLGDSFTEGVGFRFEETFAGIIAGELGKHGVEVLNAGVSSYSPSIHYRKTKYLLDEVGLEFDEVIVFLDVADTNDEAVVYQFDSQDRVVYQPLTRPGMPDWVLGQQHDPFDTKHLAARLKNFLKDNSIIVRILDIAKDAVFGEPEERMASFGGSTGHPRAMWTIEDRYFEAFGRAGLEIAAQNMDRMLGVLREKSIPLSIAVYPWPDQILHGDLNSRQVSFWRAWAKENSVQFFNFFPAVFDGTDPEANIARYYIPGDIHFNAEGNRLIAKEFFRQYQRPARPGK